MTNCVDGSLFSHTIQAAQESQTKISRQKW